METAALVSEDMIAKRKERFASQKDKDDAQKLAERQQRFKTDAGKTDVGKDADKQAERKERFQKWLPSGGSSAPGMSKPANASVAAALGTSLDNSIKGGFKKGARGKPNSSLLSTENFSDEFKAKAEVSAAPPRS